MHNNEVSPVANTEERHNGCGAEPFERMCISLYAYRFGAIGFLDLIKKFEETLGLPSPQTNDPTILSVECRKDLEAKE
jgi:hypothetical protein